VVILISYIILDAMQLSKKYILTVFKTNSLSFHSRRNKASQCVRSILHELTLRLLTLCRPDGLLIKYPQFPDLLNALNVQPHNIFLLTV